MNLKEFTIAIGFDLDDQELESLQTRIDDVKESLVEFGTYIAGAAVALGAIAHSTAEESVELSKLAAIMGVSTESASQWGYAASKAGVSIDDLTQLSAELGENIGEAAGGTGEAASAFQSLGIKLKDNKGQLRATDEVLLEIADKMQALGNGTKKTGALTGLFGEEGIKLVGILNSGSEGIKRYMQEAQDLGVVMSDDVVKQGVEASRNFATFETILKSLKNTIGAEALPVFNEWLKAFAEYWKLNRELIRGGLSKVFKIITAIVKQLVPIMTSLAKVVLWLIENWKLLAIIITTYVITALVAMRWQLIWAAIQFIELGVAAVAAAVRAGIAWAIANAPLLLFAAGIALALLLLEDLYGWFTGKDSLIGRIIDGLRGKWDEFVASLEYENPNDPWFLRIIKSAVQEVKDLIGYLKEIGQWSGEKIDQAFNFATGLHDSLQSGASTAAEFFGFDTKRQQDARAIAEMNTPENQAKLKEFASGLLNKASTLDARAYLPSSNNTSNATTKNSHVEIKPTINVQGVTGEEVAEKIVEKFKSEALAITELF